MVVFCGRTRLIGMSSPTAVIDVLHPSSGLSDDDQVTRLASLLSIDDLEKDKLSTDLQSNVFDNHLSPVIRSLHILSLDLSKSQDTPSELSRWTSQLESTATSLETLFHFIYMIALKDQHGYIETTSTRRVLRWVFGLELWLMQLRALLVTRLDKSKTSGISLAPSLEASLQSGTVRALNTLCDRLNVVFVSRSPRS